MSGPAQKGNDRHALRLATYLLSAFVVVVLLRNAWVCDDAYITFRTSFNLMEGHGPVFNPAERVQAYTNPLWMFVMALVYGATGEFYYSTIAVGLCLSLGTMWLLCRKFSADRTAQLLVLGVLLSSKAFVDYTTSGLENALTHLIVVSFGLVWFAATEAPTLPPPKGEKGARTPERQALLLGALAALGIINRLDTSLLFFPALALAAWQLRRSKRGLAWLLLGLSPVLVWELFALLYYGFPFPNTYYAKVHNGLPAGEVIHNGLLYLLDSMSRDPITLTAIVAGVASAVAVRERRGIAIGAGVLLYVLYTVRVGGDFMSGRFLTAPLVGAVMLFTRVPMENQRPLVFAATAIVVGVGLMNPYSPVRSDARYDQVPVAQIKHAPFSDERRAYFPHTSLLVDVVARPMPSHKSVRFGLEVHTDAPTVGQSRGIGMYGTFAGPQVHIIDTVGLSEPLLARLRPIQSHKWRPGHFDRALPAGYKKTIEQGRNSITDPRLAQYYDKLTVLTRGRLWSYKRLRMIWEMSAGKWDHLVDESASRFPHRQHVQLQDVATVRTPGTAWDDPGNTVLALGDMLAVGLGDARHARTIELSVSNNDDYLVFFHRAGRELGRQSIRGSLSHSLWRGRYPADRGLAVHRIEVPQAAVNAGYYQIRIAPVRGDANYSVGHVLLLGEPAAD